MTRSQVVGMLKKNRAPGQVSGYFPHITQRDCYREGWYRQIGHERIGGHDLPLLQCTVCHDMVVKDVLDG